jgi:hypothetical protein
MVPDFKDTPAAAAPADAAQPAAASIAASAAKNVRCENCGASVTQTYCGVCGQRIEPPVHSLWHFARVAAEDLTHADSRLWRTLGALLFQPGYLTLQFLAGRRARYLPPLRLYLVLSVVFFLFASGTRSNLQVLQVSLPDGSAPKVTVMPLEGATTSPLGAAHGAESAEQRAERVCNIRYSGPWEEKIAPAARDACRRAFADNGRSLREAFLHNVPRAMFLFMPLLAAVMMLMYWRPRHYYVEHLLLFVHNHAFVFLLAMLAWLASALLPFVSDWIGLGVMLYISWYMYRSMRVVYGQGRWLTLSKLFVLSFFYLVSGSLMLALTSIYSALTA